MARRLLLSEAGLMPIWGPNVCMPAILSTILVVFPSRLLIPPSLVAWQGISTFATSSIYWCTHSLTLFFFAHFYLHTQSLSPSLACCLFPDIVILVELLGVFFVYADHVRFYTCHHVYRRFTLLSRHWSNFSLIMVHTTTLRFSCKTVSCMTHTTKLCRPLRNGQRLQASPYERVFPRAGAVSQWLFWDSTDFPF